MNSKLYIEFSKELGKAQEEFEEARMKWKANKDANNTMLLEIAKCKVAQWNRAINLMYLKR